MALPLCDAGTYGTQVNAVAHPVWITAPSVMICPTTLVRHNQRFLKRLRSDNLPGLRLALRTRVRCEDVIRYERLTRTDGEAIVMLKQIAARLVTVANAPDPEGA